MGEFEVRLNVRTFSSSLLMTSAVMEEREMTREAQFKEPRRWNRSNKIWRESL